MLGGFLLLPHEVAHEVTQELCAGTVTGFRGRGEFVFQDRIDSEGESCFVYGGGSFVLQV